MDGGNDKTDKLNNEESRMNRQYLRVCSSSCRVCKNCSRKGRGVGKVMLKSRTDKMCNSIYSRSSRE